MWENWIILGFLIYSISFISSLCIISKTENWIMFLPYNHRKVCIDQHILLKLVMFVVQVSILIVFIITQATVSLLAGAMSFNALILWIGSFLKARIFVFSLLTCCFHWGHCLTHSRSSDIGWMNKWILWPGQEVTYRYLIIRPTWYSPAGTWAPQRKQFLCALFTAVCSALAALPTTQLPSMFVR